MGNRFASSQKALGVCDVCGFTYKLRELRNVYKKGRDTNIKSCPECWDGDHPQLKLGEFPVNDPQALRDPRPDSNQYSQAGCRYWIYRASCSSDFVGVNTMRKQTPKTAKKPKSKNKQVKVRGTGAATKGLYARGPMG
jgi:hypothetical protein